MIRFADPARPRPRRAAPGPQASLHGVPGRARASLGALVGLVGLLALAPAASHAASRPVYGGDLVAYVFGPPARLNPAAAPRAADRAAQAAMFEPLYVRTADGLTPVLAAGPPLRDGRTVFVPLRTGVRLHDGRGLSPQLLADALRAKITTEGAYLLAPVVGFEAARRGEAQISVFPDHRRHGVRIDLAAPYDAYPRLLAGAHAGIAVPSPSAGRDVGTGPFEFEGRTARGDVRLKPFLAHRVGRPYLDRLEFRVHNSRSSAAAWARRQAPFILFEVPDARGVPSDRLRWPRDGRAPPPWTRRLIRAPSPELAQVVDGALQRARLVKRFMSAGATPTRRLLPGLPPPPRAPRPAIPAKPRKLIVSQTDRLGWQFAKRVQLDLLRAGLSVTLQRVDGATLRARLRSPGDDLVMAAVLPDAPRTGDPFDGLHALLSIAAALGAPEAISQDDSSAFARAEPEARAGRLAEIEAALRARLGLVPIAERPPGLMVQTDARGWSVDGRGALLLEDAHRPRADRE